MRLGKLAPSTLTDFLAMQSHVALMAEEKDVFTDIVQAVFISMVAIRRRLGVTEFARAIKNETRLGAVIAGQFVGGILFPIGVMRATLGTSPTTFRIRPDDSAAIRTGFGMSVIPGSAPQSHSPIMA